MSSNLSECPLAIRESIIPKAPAISMSSPMNTALSPYFSAIETIPFWMARL